MSDQVKWFPTQQGRYTAYEPEFKDGDDWHNIPTVNAPPDVGVPQPRACGGINQTIGLFGYEQAQALAWQFAATAAAVGKRIEVRVTPYEIIYDIKARKLESGRSAPTTESRPNEKDAVSEPTRPLEEK